MPGKTSFRLLVLAALFTLAIPLAVNTPGAAADGDDNQFTIPEKAELKYPNLGSMLNQLAARVEEGEATAEDAAGDAPVHRAGSVAVTIYLSGNVDAVVRFLEDSGGSPRNVGEDYIEAYVPVSLLGPVSEQTGVIRVREIIPPESAYGNFTSQGVQAHLSEAWNQAGYSGQGVKVGIIDVGFKDLTSLMGTELPATVQARCYTDIGVFTQDLADCEAVGEVTVGIPECLDAVQRRAVRNAEHGTIVAESVIDIAPEVTLYIANPLSWADLQAAADWMASEGVSVINHSVVWTFYGPGDGTSPYSASPLNTVDLAVASDILWVNAAGNDARRTWFGGYSDPDGDEVIRFGGGNDEVIDIPVRACRRYTVKLRWDDNWDGASTDLDLYLYDKHSGIRFPVSVSEQSGGRGHVPFEQFAFRARIDSDDFGIVVHHYGGTAPGWIQLKVSGASEVEYYTGSGSIGYPAESANPGMLAVGAAPWYDTGAIEYYSSRGPTPDGRVKPDIAGADCGETALAPLNENRRGFCGTSQAAPHVAGMAALVRQRFPGYTPAQVASYLKDHAQQRETPDPNNTWGHGFAQLPSPDRAALVALYNATGGANWLENANWMTSGKLSTWHGVTTDSQGRVTELNLTRNQLKGEIRAELGSLTNLKVLALGGNELTGKIPAGLGSLANLVELYLWDNELTGVIPTELGSLGNLVQLQLSGNQLTGPIPDELGSLAKLERLSLGENQLTGQIPSQLASLTNLQRLSLYDNQLAGPIPAELGSLDNLEVLSLSGNELTGPIPPPLASLTNLQQLFLSNNQLSGPVPIWLGNLTKLERLHISRNQLTGQIPSQLASLTNLQRLSLYDNQLTGPIPASLGGLTNLERLSLSQNQLSGTIPTELGSLTNLTILSLWGNEMTGEIPVELGSLANLVELSLPQNQLTGGIPAGLGSLASLERLYLTRNQLTGTIPTQLGNLTSLTVLALGGNQLTGPIPTSLGGLTNLEGVYLWGNELTGTIPAELGSLANLVQLQLSENQLTGTIPSQVGSLATLEVLALDDNELTGAIPSELGSLTNLQELHLTRNQLSGAIPAELGSLTKLTLLRLENNQLSGVVPQTLAELTMLERFSFYNNPGLCAPVDDAFQIWLRGISIVYGSSCAQADSPEDRAVLVQVHSATGGVNWKNNAKWLSGDLTREWYGVTNDANGRVHGLFLGGNQLTGEMPAELGNLANLRLLSLRDNQLTGEISPELGRLANLERLRLHNNQLSGEIPAELGSLTNLEHLRLDGNQLTGEIPAELGSLTNLTVLYLSGNRLTGCVPASLKDVADNDFAQLGLTFCASGDPLIARYDANGNGQIDRSEVIKAINDYLFGEGDPISRADVIRLINLYLFGPPAAQQSGASEELDGGGQRADADRPVVESSHRQGESGHHRLPD